MKMIKHTNKPPQPSQTTVDPEHERQCLINQMTNWQRSQFARTDYPRDLDEVFKFTVLPHWKQLSR